jgi:hypothetical protein
MVGRGHDVEHKAVGVDYEEVPLPVVLVSQLQGDRGCPLPCASVGLIDVVNLDREHNRVLARGYSAATEEVASRWQEAQVQRPIVGGHELQVPVEVDAHVEVEQVDVELASRLEAVRGDVRDYSENVSFVRATGSR